MSSSLIDAVRTHLPVDLDLPAGLDTDQQRDLVDALAAVPDPRRRRGVRYRLASLLAVAVCAVPAGAPTFAAARAHGIGVVTAADPADYDTWEEREEARRVEPDPERLNTFAATQLSDTARDLISRRLR